MEPRPTQVWAWRSRVVGGVAWWEESWGGRGRVRVARFMPPRDPLLKRGSRGGMWNYAFFYAFSIIYAFSGCGIRCTTQNFVEGRITSPTGIVY